MKIKDFLIYCFPEGTNIVVDEQQANQAVLLWDIVPVWPPDTFGFCARLLEKSGAFARVGIDPSGGFGFALEKAHHSKVRRAAKGFTKLFALTAKASEGRLDFPLPMEIETWWQVVIDHQDCSIAEIPSKPKLVQALFGLMAVSDDVAAGIGWLGEVGEDSDELVPGVIAELFSDGERRQSLCKQIPSDRLVVLPKAITPTVGCTVRSTSNHLSLLPPITVIRANWVPTFHGAISPSVTNKAKVSDHDQFLKPLNLLLVPYPYDVSGHCFEDDGPIFSGSHQPSAVKRDRLFKVNQKWLSNQQTGEGYEIFETHVHPLLKKCLEEVDSVAGVIFPEASLSESAATDLQNAYLEHMQSDNESRKVPIEFLIAGISDHLDGEKTGKNSARIFFFDSTKKKLLASAAQGKHHRWCLDRSQVARYQLGNSLTHKHGRWWENIDVSDRQLFFFPNRANSCFAVLICEDLARHDPAMPVIQAVGPNLVIALLMDGPQLKLRWPNQYAAVLANDPGSSVLTLTNVGMCKRADPVARSSGHVVGLWKEHGGEAQELILPRGAEGLLVTLSPHLEEQVTLDGRSDLGTTLRYELTGCQPLQTNNGA